MCRDFPKPETNPIGPRANNNRANRTGPLSHSHSHLGNGTAAVEASLDHGVGAGLDLSQQSAQVGERARPHAVNARNLDPLPQNPLGQIQRDLKQAFSVSPNIKTDS